MRIGGYIGIALLVWVAFDILAGKTWLHREVSRKHEPGFYWALIVIWLVLALSLFGFGFYG